MDYVTTHYIKELVLLRARVQLAYFFIQLHRISPSRWIASIARYKINTCIIGVSDIDGRHGRFVNCKIIFRHDFVK